MQPETKDKLAVGMLLLLALIPIIFFGIFGAGNENVKPYSIGKSNDGVFEAYTFRHNQHRCFVVTTKENLIDLECP